MAKRGTGNPFEIGDTVGASKQKDAKSSEDEMGFVEDGTTEVANKPEDQFVPQVNDAANESVLIQAPKEIEKHDDENEEYNDMNSVTIMLVKNYSLYRKANDKVLGKRNDYIGSSVLSSRILASSKEEVEAYFPNIIGLSPNNVDFISRVKQYLNNIRIPVDELGKTFDISFHYNRKKDYYIIKSQMDEVEQKYAIADKKSIMNMKKALNEKITKINLIEASKCKMGYPLNVDDYLMYRHCLLYPDVAKDMALINSDVRIRFYIKDEQKEAEKMKKYRQEVNRAKSNYVSCLADDELFDAIYVQYCVISNLPIAFSLAESRIDREIKLDKFSTEEPVKFNRIFANKDVKLIANIEKLISRGELVRSNYNQNISTPDGDFIGANISEAVVWFKSPEHGNLVNAWMNKLKNI